MTACNRIHFDVSDLQYSTSMHNLSANKICCAKSDWSISRDILISDGQIYTFLREATTDTLFIFSLSHVPLHPVSVTKACDNSTAWANVAQSCQDTRMESLSTVLQLVLRFWVQSA